MVAVNLTIGMCTRPWECGLFVSCEIAGTSLREMFRDLVIMLIPLLILLLLITYVPAVVTWLPDFLGSDLSIRRIVMAKPEMEFTDTLPLDSGDRWRERKKGCFERSFPGTRYGEPDPTGEVRLGRADPEDPGHDFCEEVFSSIEGYMVDTTEKTDCRSGYYACRPVA